MPEDPSVFRALADPTRRQILRDLKDGDELSTVCPDQVVLRQQRRRRARREGSDT